MPATTVGRWIGASEAARIIGVDRRAIERLASRGLLSMLCLPGERTRYSESECHDLKLATTILARPVEVGGAK